MKSCWHLDRRTFLRGCGGIALPLPFLNAMVLGNESKAAAELPRRVAFIFFPNGISLPPESHADHEQWYWYPKETDDGFEFRESQKYLNAHKDDISIVKGLRNGSGAPHGVPTTFLTCKTLGNKDKRNAVSIDQVIAEGLNLRTQTPLESLVLSTAGGVGGLGRSHTISFDKRGAGIPGTGILRKVYEKMFEIRSVENARMLQHKRHLVDSVLEDSKRLSRRLGKDDQKLLDEYLGSLSDVEKRVNNDIFWAKAIGSRFDGIMDEVNELNLEVTYEDAETYIQTMYDLIYLAFKADLTRVITYQIAVEGGGQSTGMMAQYAGCTTNIHDLSHNSTKKSTGYYEWAQWDQFLAKQFAHLIKRLGDTTEGDARLLDRCLLLQGSAASKVHNNSNYPMMLAGGKAMGHNTGQIVSVTENSHQRAANLYVQMARAMGLPLKEFSTSTGYEIPGLFG